MLQLDSKIYFWGGNMKKILALLLAFVMVLSLSACGETNTDKPATEENGEGNEETTSSAITKIGLGVVVDLSKSKADDNGAAAQSDATIAGVAFDADGKIVKAIIDVAQDKVAVTDGVYEKVEGFKSKKELGPEYGMKEASANGGIGKEWDEQATFFEEYIVGKTADEVAGLAVDETTKPTDADLLAGATIHIGTFQEAVKKAWDNAVEAPAAEKLGLGIASGLGRSSDADAEKGASVTFEDVISLVALDSDGKVVASITDIAQNNVKFTVDGMLDGEYAAGTTKKELGSNYGMKEASANGGIGKEWDEQAAAYDAYLVGKTADEVKAIDLDENGVATDADLVAGATISVTDFKLATEEALANVQ